MPVSTVLSDYHGIDGIALSVPSIVSASGVRPIRETPFSAQEEARLQASGDALRSLAGVARLLIRENFRRRCRSGRHPFDV